MQRRLVAPKRKLAESFAPALGYLSGQAEGSSVLQPLRRSRSHLRLIGAGIS